MADCTSNEAPPPVDAREQPIDVSQVRARLVRLAVKLVWNRDDAEEIAQEAFRLCLDKGMAPADPAFVPWLLRTVGNLCMNRRRARRFGPLEPWLERAPTESPSVFAERAERLSRVRAAIDELPEQQRLALVLRTMDGLNYEEIATVMELSVAAVRTHVHLARRRLMQKTGDSDQ